MTQTSTSTQTLDADRSARDAALSPTREQGAVLSRCFQIGFGELQARVARGDEDDRLAEMVDAFDAYFAMCHAKLGHDRVPILTWETYMAIRRRVAARRVEPTVVDE